MVTNSRPLVRLPKRGPPAPQTARPVSSLGTSQAEGQHESSRTADANWAEVFLASMRIQGVQRSEAVSAVRAQLGRTDTVEGAISFSFRSLQITPTPYTESIQARSSPALSLQAAATSSTPDTLSSLPAAATTLTLMEPSTTAHVTSSAQISHASHATPRTRDCHGCGSSGSHPWFDVIRGWRDHG